MEYLTKQNAVPAATFVSGPLWADFKRCLLARRPVGASPEDQPHVAAAKGFRREAWEACIAEIEKLPTDYDTGETNPFDRPSITDQKD